VFQVASAAEKAAWIKVGATNKDKDGDCFAHLLCSAKGLVSVIELRKEGNQSRITATTRSSQANESLSRSSAAVLSGTTSGVISSHKFSDSVEEETSGDTGGTKSGKAAVRSDESEGSVERSK
jgi:hypothetical protein